MYPRTISIDNNYSFFLFGARAVGKSTLIRQFFNADLVIDLLNPKQESRFSMHPEELLALCDHLKPSSKVFIDEVQKVPQLLDVVHKLIEEKNLIFALSGSSARKLKRKGANLLAGRAFLFYLFPLTAKELGSDFDLDFVLQWGSLAKIFSFSTDRQRSLFLEAYVQTYLREEIRIEQLVRNIPAFTKFLEVAAQMNAQPLNYSKLGSDLGIDHSQVRSYYEILEDTLIGFSLPAYEKSVRQQVRKAKKFYFFDIGVKRELENVVGITPRKSTFEYGKLFEHFVILEVIRRSEYEKSKFKFFYLRTKDDVEVDLVIERMQQPTLFVEIKSSDNITQSQTSRLNDIARDHKAVPVLVSQDRERKKHNAVHCLYWQDFIEGCFASEPFLKDHV